MTRRAWSLRALRTREWVSREVGFALVGLEASDRMIVSYPRSGSTWIRTILGNVLVPWARSSPDVFNALIPGVTIRGAIAARGLSRPRAISSHCDFRPGLPRVLYALRDGRDVLVSLYHYRITRWRREHEVSFERFFDEHLAGEHGTPWHVSVGGWLERGRTMGHELHVVRYEDLVATPISGIAEACAFLSVPHTRESLERAISEASLENMRRIEADRLGARPPTNRSFYRRGSIGQWTEWLAPDLERRFERAAGDVLVRAGYRLGRDTRPRASLE